MQLVTKVDTCVSLHLHILQPIGLLMSCLYLKLGRLVFLLDIKMQNAICENCRYVLNQGEI
jgi:predicted DNA-binding helix-hairpin-helix protein